MLLSYSPASRKQQRDDPFLSDAHLAMLREESDIPDAMIEARGYRTVTDHKTIVRQYAIWCANQSEADADTVFASTFRVNQQFGSPFDLKALKRIVRKAMCERPVPEIATRWLDPATVHLARQTVADVQAALQTLLWPGAFAHNCQLAMIHILNEMHRTGKTTIALSCRDLGDKLGVTSKTAGLYSRALCGNIPGRRATVPVLLTAKTFRTSDPLAANLYHLRPRRAWRVPGGLLMSVVKSAEKMGEKSAENAEKFTTRQRVLDVIGRYPIASAKELATTAAGLSGKTAELALTWLRKNGLVNKIAGVYRLMVPHPRHAAVPDLAHDAFRARGLGKTGAVVLAAIEREPIHTARELADATELTRDRAERALTRLIKAGVVAKIGGTYRRINKPLEHVARELGTAGVGEKQRARHAHEREEFDKKRHSGELQPSFGKKNLHVQPTPQPPELVWSDDEQPVLRQAACWKPYRRDSTREGENDAES